MFKIVLQDEKNQVLTTNIWLRMVRIHERLSVFGVIMDFSAVTGRDVFCLIWITRCLTCK